MPPPPSGAPATTPAADPPAAATVGDAAAAAAVADAASARTPAALLRPTRTGAHLRWLCVAVFAQGLALAQPLRVFVQERVHDAPGARAHGFSAALQAEWVPMVWCWLAAAALLAARPRRRTAIVAAGWTALHGGEHLYLLARSARVDAELDDLGLARDPLTRALPGIAGRDGWLARHVPWLREHAAWLTASPRSLVHLGWAVGDVVLALLALWVAWYALRRQRARPATPPLAQPSGCASA